MNVLELKTFFMGDGIFRCYSDSVGMPFGKKNQTKEIMKKTFSTVFLLSVLLFVAGCGNGPKTVAQKWHDAICKQDLNTANSLSAGDAAIVNQLLVNRMTEDAEEPEVIAFKKAVYDKVVITGNKAVVSVGDSKDLKVVLVKQDGKWLVSPQKDSEEEEEKTVTIKCTNQLHMIGTAFRMYCDDNDDSFPPSSDWITLLNKEVGDLKCFKCEGTTYRFFPNGGKEGDIPAPSQSIVATCDKHGDKVNVLFVDGHVATVKKKDVDEAIKNAPSGKLPVLKIE